MGGAGRLAFVLSVVAGSADAVGLLGFGLFTAHITGNLAVLAVHAALGRPASAALLASVPVFVAAVAAARWCAGRLADGAGRRTLRPLLLGQLLLFAGFLALVCAGELAGAPDFGGPEVLTGPHTAAATAAVLLAVAAMAVQNALVQTALSGAPPTAVMTTNLTRVTVAVTDLAGHRRDRGHTAETQARARARAQVVRSGPVVAGFVAGAGLAAGAYAVLGWGAAVVPVALAAAALPLGGDGSGREGPAW